jgi:tripartite ATP-independent transporter DctP family solute receptor
MDFRNSIIRASVIVAAIAASAFGAQAETFRLAHHHAVGSATDIAANKLAELVKAKSEGRITLQVFPGAQLGQEREAFDLMNQGGIDISLTSTAIPDGIFPPMAVTGVPYVFRGWDHAIAAYNGEFGQGLINGMRESTDVEVLGFFHIGFRDLLFAKEPRTTVKELADLKMRSPESFVWIRMFELLGTQPTPVTWGEVYTAMQTGVADGLDSPASAALDNNFDEVTSSLVKTGHMFGSMMISMNENKFNALTAEDQAVMKAAAVEMGNYMDNEVTIPAERDAYARLEAAGVTVVEAENIEEWRAAVAPLLAEVRARYEGSGEFIDMLLAE